MHYISDEMELRKLLWLHHGCDGLYGDDGEMQCNKCHIDFKRDTIEEIETTLRNIRMELYELRKKAEHTDSRQ